MNHRGLRPWAGAALLAIHTVVVSAADSGDGLTLRDALAVVAESNPDLKALMFELPALEGRREQAGLRPNPELALDIENVAGTGRFDSASSAEITLALSQVIELGDKRQLRIGAADAAYSAAESELRVFHVDLASEVLRRFVDAARAQEQLALAQRRSGLSDVMLAAVEARVSAARSPQAELHRARAAREGARLDLQNTERELVTTLHRLAALWGESNPSFSSVRADLYSLPQLAVFDSLVERLQESPEVQSLLSEGRLRDAELRLAQAKARPDLTMGGGIRRIEESNDFALVLSLQMPLAIYDRNQGAIREARIRREQSNARYDAAFNRARADLFAFNQELGQARAEVEALRGRVLPELEAALKDTETAYQRGRYSYLEFADAQRSLIEANAALIEAAARYHMLLAEIERLTGESFALPAY